MKLFLILMSIIFFLKYASAIKGVKYWDDEWYNDSPYANRRNANSVKPWKFIRKV